MSVTLKQIALHTGLSVPTVGNVLGRSASRYSPQTRQRVMQAVRDLGYKPNSSARAMRKGRIGCAALVLSRSHQQTHSYIPAGLLDGLDDELARHNMHLAVSRLTDEELSRDDFPPKFIREYMADGMIVNYTHEIPAGMLEMIHAHHTPAVWLNAKLRSDCVYPDDRTAGMEATRLLVEHGHRRIAFLHFISPTAFVLDGASFEAIRPRFHYSVAARAEGYVQVMREAGLTPRITHHDRFVPEANEMAICRDLLSGEDRPTAVVVYSDRDVTPLVCAAAEARLAVPRDLSVIGFFPLPLWVGGKYITAARVPTAEVGRRAVKMLLQKIEFPDEAQAPEAVPFDEISGETVAYRGGA